MINSKDLSRLKTGLEILENNNDQREYILNNFQRLKSNVPFSKRLNEFIDNWYAEFVKSPFKPTIRWVEEDDFDDNDIEGTFKKHLERYGAGGVIQIWTGSSENTIFGNEYTNHKFRAWHDYTHLSNGLGYDEIGESIVCDIQKSELPIDWYYERELLHIEVVGQIHYHSLHGSFVENQRQFTIDYMLNPIKALR